MTSVIIPQTYKANIIPPTLFYYPYSEAYTVSTIFKLEPNKSTTYDIFLMLHTKAVKQWKVELHGNSLTKNRQPHISKPSDSLHLMGAS